ncbi:hypothetical protein [Salinispirillum marinum]
MNIVGAIGLGVLGIALFINKLGQPSTGTFVLIVAYYAVLAGIPALTARALMETSSNGLRRSMLWANGLLIGLWCVSLVGSLMLKQPFSLLLAGALLFVLPQTVNIIALRGMRQANE